MEEVLSNATGNSSTSSCGVWDEDTEYTVNMCSYWMEGVLLTSTGTIGLIGNVFSIVILSKPDMYNAFNQLLIALSTLDSVFIFLAIVDYSLTRWNTLNTKFEWSNESWNFYCRAFNMSSQIFNYLFPYVIYPLNNISFCASIFSTVALAYERHTAVCKPIHYRNVTAKYSVKRRTLW